MDEALRQLESSLAPGEFDPARAERSFVLAMADATAATVMPGLVATLARDAPGVSIRVLPLTTRDPRQLLDDGQVDLAVGYFPAVLADLTAHMVRAALANPTLCGLYHVAAAGETTWNGYARHVLGFAHDLGLSLRATADTVDPVATSAFPTPARRPHNSRLDTTRLRESFGLELPRWQSGVERMLREVLGR